MQKESEKYTGTKSVKQTTDSHSQHASNWLWNQRNHASSVLQSLNVGLVTCLHTQLSSPEQASALAMSVLPQTTTGELDEHYQLHFINEE